MAERVADAIVVGAAVTKSSPASISVLPPRPGRDAMPTALVTAPVLKKNGSSAHVDGAARIETAATSRESFQFMIVLLGNRADLLFGAAASTGRRDDGDRSPRDAPPRPRVRGEGRSVCSRRSRMHAAR
jgi:hypothetical protein